jgi:HprK-related kinase A
MPTLATTPHSEIGAALAGDGLVLDVGLMATRVRSDAPRLGPQIASAYRHFPFQPARGALPWADLHVRIRRARGLRRWFGPQVLFVSDGDSPFEPFPADTALPLLEWSGNWLIGRRMNHVLLLHAGVLERDGRALVMPALPGSGKSTLTAALSLRGWRLLSDEFGAYDPDVRGFVAVLKPVALKNQSIDVIRRFEPAAELGPEFPKTRKGTVAHLAPQAAAVCRRAEPALPGAIVLPRWEAGSATRLLPIGEQVVFSALAFNAFNYSVMGEIGFGAAARLTRLCPAWQLVYGDLDDATAALARLWPEVIAQHREWAGVDAAADDGPSDDAVP